MGPWNFSLPTIDSVNEFVSISTNGDSFRLNASWVAHGCKLEYVLKKFRPFNGRHDVIETGTLLWKKSRNSCRTLQNCLFVLETVIFTNEVTHVFRKTLKCSFLD